MKGKVQRAVFSKKTNRYRTCMCAPPGNKQVFAFGCQNENPALCTLRKASLTIEAALILPFFLMVLLAFFSFFLQYVSAAELKIRAAAEAKKLGITMGSFEELENGEVVIYKSDKLRQIWNLPFGTEDWLTEKAVCRAWIGFTELEDQEMYVYITPEGSVYHLYRDCTHLDLSVQRVPFLQAVISKNQYGETYRECERCREDFGALVYITEEGNCYHSERSCSGLKRTIRQVPISTVGERAGCLRCLSKGE